MSPIVTTMSAPAGRGRRVKAPSGSGVAPFFEDSFAGGQFNPSGGFVYSNTLGNSSNFSVVAAGSPGAEVKAGFTHSIQGTAIGKPLGGENGDPQLNFSWTTGVDELWFEWELHVPSNYEARNNYDPGPPLVSKADNNKFWLFYSTVYSTANYPQASCEVRQLSASGSAASDGKAYIKPDINDSATGDIETLVGNANKLIAPEGPIVPGTWNTIRGHIRKESSIGAADGIWEMWVNGTLHTRITGIRLGSSDAGKAAAGFTQGYLLGYANSGYTNDTVFHIQWIKFYSTNPGW